MLNKAILLHHNGVRDSIASRTDGECKKVTGSQKSLGTKEFPSIKSPYYLSSKYNLTKPTQQSNKA